MRGVLLAGGTGSRLRPLTKVINKHLLAVGSLPMIYYPLNQFKNCGIEDVMIITGVEHAGTILQQLGSGQEFGMKFTYRVQDEPLGIAQALLLAEDFVGKDRVMVQLGDNLFGESLGPYKEIYSKGFQELEAMVLLKEVPDPHRFGVAVLKSNVLIDIEEKPIEPKSNLAITGCYFYPYQVFDVIKSLEPSDRGEYEISDVNKHFLKEGYLGYSILDEWWTDAGTPSSLKKAQELIS